MTPPMSSAITKMEPRMKVLTLPLIILSDKVIFFEKILK